MGRLTKRFLAHAAIIGALAASFPAYAELTKDATEAFGIIGTLADDCLKSSEDMGKRYIFTASFLGNVTFQMRSVIVLEGRKSITILDARVVSATRVTEDKLKFSFEVTNARVITNEGIEKPIDVLQGVHDAYAQKLGPFILLGSGQTVEQYEKCLN